MQWKAAIWAFEMLQKMPNFIIYEAELISAPLYRGLETFFCLLSTELFAPVM
jgi:hypothetical protein